MKFEVKWYEKIFVALCYLQPLFALVGLAIGLIFKKQFWLINSLQAIVLMLSFWLIVLLFILLDAVFYMDVSFAVGLLAIVYGLIMIYCGITALRGRFIGAPIVGGLIVKICNITNK